MSAVVLNVVSENNVNCTSYATIFDTDLMSNIRANQNPATTPTFTEAGDTGGVFTLWNFSSPSGKLFDGQVLYWVFENSGTTRTVRIYSNSTRTNLVAEGTRVIANGANATIFLREMNESGIEGSVLATIGGGGATDDTDVANTITITNIYDNSDLELAGATQFIYETPDEIKIKYTVSETVAQINLLAGGFELYSGEVVGYIDSTTGFTTGASYAVQRVDGLGDLAIPADCVIDRAWYLVTETFKSAFDAATIEIGIETDDANGIVAGTAISAGGNVWDAGKHDAIPDGTGSAITDATTAQRNVIYTLGAAEDLTAGGLILFVHYVKLV